jgi:phycocyanobilin:ferredoxin oxidoreductase
MKKSERNAWLLMELAASRFRDRLKVEPKVIESHEPSNYEKDDNFQWNNVFLKADSFRQGHIETFVVPNRFAVLHVCIFPFLDDPRPIFGFDMIAGSSKVTGIFLDFSQTNKNFEEQSLGKIVSRIEYERFSKRREMPDWGYVFSPDALAIRPVDSDEVELAVVIAHRALDAYLSHQNTRQIGQIDEITAGQKRYIAAQRQNKHTFRTLAGFIGPERARSFINDKLFPEVT